MAGKNGANPGKSIENEISARNSEKRCDNREQNK